MWSKTSRVNGNCVTISTIELAQYVSHIRNKSGTNDFFHFDVKTLRYFSRGNFRFANRIYNTQGFLREICFINDVFVIIALSILEGESLH